MISHLMVGTNDIAKARAFYDGALGAIGVPASDPALPVAYYTTGVGPGFVVITPRNGEPATAANGGTIGFIAPDTTAIDAFHAAGLAAGGSDEGAPGDRHTPDGPRYGAYLRDPDGNKICAFAAATESAA